VMAAVSSPAGKRRKAAAITYAALSEGLVCVESVITAPAHRGKGHGRRLLESAFAWAAANGAVGACLQVEASNAPGLALYERLGFERNLYGYHYRRAPQPV
ncbi:MAG: GNAT family N-acetyltransferase, partial [Pseudomonadota bacterium]